MKILVAVASKHGSTREIAEAIAEELRTQNLDADLCDVGEVESIAGYDAVILGSAVYMGNWLAEAKAFATRQSGKLATIPVWLFSSGPTGPADQASPADPNGLAELLAATGARGHVIFAGKADPKDLGLGERLIIRLVHAPQGDFRDWDDIREWARTVGTALTQRETVGAQG
jgi:menaquinone-dependent protoporphyrinogen oxidase